MNARIESNDKKKKKKVKRTIEYILHLHILFRAQNNFRILF